MRHRQSERVHLIKLRRNVAKCASFCYSYTSLLFALNIPYNHGNKYSFQQFPWLKSLAHQPKNKGVIEINFLFHERKIFFSSFSPDNSNLAS